MTQPRSILCFAILAAALLPFPPRAAAQVAPACSQSMNASNQAPSAPFTGASSSQQAQRSLFSLPPDSQPVVSAALGREDASYHLVSSGVAMRLENRAQSLGARFTQQGMELSAGQQRWRLALLGYGYGERLAPALAAAPYSQANRVEYRRGPLVEWYVNGPLGLEQGFTLAQPPNRKRGKKSEPLTFAFAVDGDLQASFQSAQKDEHASRPQQLTLRDAAGQPMLRYTGLTAHDATGRELPAWLELGKKELRLRVTDARAHYPVVVDPFIEQAQLAVGGGRGLGSAVAVSGDGKTIAVSDVFPQLGFGSVLLFSYGPLGWALQGTISFPGGVVEQVPFFGRGLALSCDGGLVVIGTPNALQQGNAAAYVFLRPASGRWLDTRTPAATLTASDAVPGSLFGSAVGVSGDGSVVVSGALLANPNVAGATYVFVRPVNGWTDATETAKLTASDGAGGDHLGSSVGISDDGNTVAAGAPQCPPGFDCGFNIPGANGRGAVYVFTKPVNGWVSENETAKLTASDPAINMGVGTSVAIKGGGTIVAGAPATFTLFPSPPIPGAAYVFARPAGGWLSSTETAKLTPADGVPGDLFGTSVAITSGGRPFVGPPEVILVGAPAANESHGAVYAFSKPFSGWATTSTFDDKLVVFDAGQLGASVGVGRDLTAVAVGAPFSYHFAGTAYAFTGVSTVSFSANILNFGNVGVGASATRKVTLTNNGSQPLNVAAVTAAEFLPTFPVQVLVSSPDRLIAFSSTTNCVAASPLAPGGSCTETVTLAPGTSGMKFGKLLFADDSAGAIPTLACVNQFNSEFPLGCTQAIELGGTGILTAGSATSITSLAPSPSLVGSPVAVSYSVAAQAGSGFAPSGAVTVTSSTGESCIGLVTLGFCSLTFPTVGQRTIKATYLGDQNLGPSTSLPTFQNVADFAITATPASQAILPGHPALYTLTLTPISGFSGAISLGCSAGVTNSTCSATPNSLTLPASTSAQATVTLPPNVCASGGTITVTFTASFQGAKRSTTATLTVR